MPGLMNITKSDIEEFMSDRCLMQIFTLPVVCLRESFKYGTQNNLTIAEQQFFDAVVSDLDKIDQLLTNFKGCIPQAQSKFGVTEDAENGYRIERLEYIGRHVVSITRPGRDNFYWTIGVKDRGNANTESNLVTGYYHMGTNGRVSDAREALESTQHLFPKVTAPQHGMRLRSAGPV